MWDPAQYQLLDFGGGRKLERFAGICTDRPSPAADQALPAHPDLWAAASARYDRADGDRGHWTMRQNLPQSWLIQPRALKLELKLTPFGHLGVFPEQVSNWQWLAEQIRHAGQPLRVLNLFAYTGASTLAAAEAGAEVTHVDAARTTVAWARRNAAHSGLADRPIRWVVEDARKFVQRELKRGKRYDGILLDPPTYGHGPRAQAWKLTEHLPALLEDCGALLDQEGRFVLLTCHAPGIGPQELRRLLKGAMAGQLELTAEDGRTLPSGVYARWSR